VGVLYLRGGGEGGISNTTCNLYHRDWETIGIGIGNNG